jgi:CheY-like chemotaxis protein
MDGLEILKRIRGEERLRGLPVVALTAHAMTGDRERFLAAGFNDYIAKPIVDEGVPLPVVLGRMMATNPEDRYESAGDARAALSALL